MRRLTTCLRRTGRLEHAMRAVIALEGTSAPEPRSLREVMERSPGPRRFLSTILIGLTRAGVIGSTRGPRGGYWLTRPLQEISVLDVVRAVAPDEAPAPSDETPHLAGLTGLLDVVDDRIGELLAGVSVADLAAA